MLLDLIQKFSYVSKHVKELINKDYLSDSNLSDFTFNKTIIERTSFLGVYPVNIINVPL
jgi:hypothetical protein